MTGTQGRSRVQSGDTWSPGPPQHKTSGTRESSRQAAVFPLGVGSTQRRQSHGALLCVHYHHLRGSSSREDMWLSGIILPILRVYYIGAKVILQQLFSRPFTLPVFPSQYGKVAIVTGGAKGMGYYTAKHLSMLGMHVIIAGNNEIDGSEAVKRIRHDTMNEKAGVMLVPERKTMDGFEEHFGLNYLGHFLLTNLLLKTMKKSGTHTFSTRVITVSSATHYVGELNLTDLQSSYCYSPHGAYAQSKLALVLFTYHLQHHLTAEGSYVTANVVDPGVVNTELYKNVCWAGRLVKWLTAWIFFKTAEEGAATSIYASVSPELEGIGGCFLSNGNRTKSVDLSYNEELQTKLWTESCKMVGIFDVFTIKL
ncbi:polyprenol dehydrogenase isoform X2 [Ascaphus truei]|uniref:polyprenol dehydrogenase isoform X2 n=1 Tax=Ascaphus truei TaxID=8439 RepID=UPI003F5AC689